MTLIDVLFWLLIALMGGVGWAVEVGLAHRYRALLASCVAACLSSGLFIMFWIDDNTSIHYDKVAPMVSKKGKAKNGLNVIEEDDKGGGGGDAKDGSGGAGGKDGGEDGGVVVDMRRKVYSRAPFKDCPECPDMVILPEGSFLAGSAPEEAGRSPDERAPTRVAIAKPFAIGRLEILRSEFQSFVANTGYVSKTQCDLGKRRGKFSWQQPGFEQDARHPVTCLSAEDVETYLKWLTSKAGREYRLPVETEWEYAARSNTDTPYWTGEVLLRHQGNFGRSRDGTTPAGSFGSNGFGLSDMSGSLWEMTSECKPAPNAPAPQPSAPPASCDRLMKGGGWNSPASTARHAARLWQSDASAHNHIGIRVVRPVDERDNDKILTKDQRIAQARDEKAAAEIRTKEQTDTDASRREARDAAAKSAEIAAFKASEKAAATKAAAEAKAKAEIDAFNKKNAQPPAKK